MWTKDLLFLSVLSVPAVFTAVAVHTNLSYFVTVRDHNISSQSSSSSIRRIRWFHIIRDIHHVIGPIGAHARKEAEKLWNLFQSEYVCKISTDLLSDERLNDSFVFISKRLKEMHRFCAFATFVDCSSIRLSYRNNWIESLAGDSKYNNEMIKSRHKVLSARRHIDHNHVFHFVLIIISYVYGSRVHVLVARNGNREITIFIV